MGSTGEYKKIFQSRKEDRIAGPPSQDGIGLRGRLYVFNVDGLGRFVVSPGNFHLLPGEFLRFLLVVELVGRFLRGVIQHELAPIFTQARVQSLALVVLVILNPCSCEPIAAHWLSKISPAKVLVPHHNPVKRDWIEKPGEWPWSSWRFYDLGDASILSMDPKP